MALTCRHLPITVALALALGTPSAPAQPPAAAIFPAGQLWLADLPARCGSVQTLVANISDIAEAMPGWIILNPRILTMPGPIQHFWYAHECGHHLLGPDEQRADCWAIRTGRDQGWFQPADFAWMDQHMRHYPGDATHLPGPQRVAHLRACYDDRTPAEAAPL
ncbi:hypothetical protein PMI04_008765 [Sphingobium sp. AP49]|uniref:hypothetical protein n=1 Tax=Sphingobium sp. AP49 TaxID=1144307 RepID=UPI00026EC8E9|nr:hypothetical protein [Sphingobium sp. AP49]WHO40662.1 hypothetical protein PMI04_008765 [Sphingobium sp. AP49]